VTAEGFSRTIGSTTAGLTMVADLGRDAAPTTRPVLERSCVFARDGYR
jgi:hypothetical protein